MFSLRRTTASSLLSQWHQPGRFAPRAAAGLQKRDITIEALDQQRRGRERVVILGSGWAGYTLARSLDPRKFQIIMVSPRSYFVFTPLLASTSVGTLEFRTALESIRGNLRQCVFFQGWADAVNFEKKTLTIEERVNDPKQSKALTGDGHHDEVGVERQGAKDAHLHKGALFEFNWDKLVVAVGCYAQTFKIKGVKDNAFFLKDVGDARRIRRRLLTCFEKAALPTTPEIAKKQLLNFVVVGGGPTGIEFSAELHDIINEDLKKLYPFLMDHVKITVYDVAPSVLGMFEDSLSKYAMEQFKRKGIQIRTGHQVEELYRGASNTVREQNNLKEDDSDWFTIKFKEQGEIGTGMCVWSTGLMTNPFIAKALKGKVKRMPKSGTIVTNDRLQIMGEDDSVMHDVYGIGDCAIIDGKTYPATAQVASQKALWLSKHLSKGDIEQQRFVWKDLGIMAYVGNWNAVLQREGANVSGRLAWFIWRGAYLAKSISWRNRILVLTYWLVNGIFGRDISRF